MFRRDFLRLASLTAGAVPFSGKAGLVFDEAFHNESPEAGSDLFAIFQNPSNAYRPMVRWWWNGDRVTADEVVRELGVLEHAGIGGVEINPIKFPSGADPVDTKALIWMSDEWLSVLKVATNACRQRQMTCDMIVGSGWPYGGEFLAREDQTQMLALGTREFSGPQHVRISASDLLAEVSPRFVSPYKDPLKELFALTLVPHELNGVEAAVPVRRDTEADVIEFDVPEGRHNLYFLVKLTGFMEVINGAPGASGPVLNHYSAQSVEKYLDRLSDKLTAFLGPLDQHFRAFFTDSIELEGANWCDDMLVEFKRRRGYDLAPYLPFVLFKVGEMGNAVSEPYGSTFSPELKQRTQRVRYDFEITKHELFQERFVGTFVNWCHRIGVKSRMQAYGMECDPVAAGMMLDIPECETWIRSEQVEEFGNGHYAHGRNYTMINKFVSSAAHLAGKQLISCEEMTNTDDPFGTSLDRIKVAGDQSILSGVTQSVLHGFNYSPLAAPFPGWVRYGTYFSERNTWWPYFHLWTTYKARLSALFQHAEMQADIAILPPQADLASLYGFQRDPFPRVAYPQYLFKLWEVIHQNGSGCDYLSEEIIAQSTIEAGRIVFRDRAYKAIILPAVESIHPATATQLQLFVKAGGKVIFCDTAPHQAPGLKGEETDSKLVAKTISDLRGDYPDNCPLVTVDENNMLTWYGGIQKRYNLQPAVALSSPREFISQIHYRNGEREIFFLTNYGPSKSVSFEASFNVSGKLPWHWNPETGERTPTSATANNILTLTLGPSESKLIVFEAASEKSRVHERAHPASTDKSGERTLIPGPWDVKLMHADGSERTIVLQDLVDFSQRDDLKSFAGTILYSKQVRWEANNLPAFLVLGHLHAVSELQINGKPVGTRWYGEQRYEISGAVVPGVNRISIKVVTTLGDSMKTLKDNRTAEVWTSRTPTYPMGLTEVYVSS